MYKVIIAGGRDFQDYALLKKTVDRFLSDRRDDITILCGKAPGADTLGEQYAQEHGHTVEYFPAHWQRYGRAAGCIRNREMAEKADALVAFWNGKSRGTEHMIDMASQRRLKVWIERYGEKESGNHA